MSEIKYAGEFQRVDRSYETLSGDEELILAYSLVIKNGIVLFEHGPIYSSDGYKTDVLLLMGCGVVARRRIDFVSGYQGKQTRTRRLVDNLVVRLGLSFFHETNEGLEGIAMNLGLPFNKSRVSAH